MISNKNKHFPVTKPSATGAHKTYILIGKNMCSIH